MERFEKEQERNRCVFEMDELSRKIYDDGLGGGLPYDLKFLSKNGVVPKGDLKQFKKYAKQMSKGLGYPLRSEDGVNSLAPMGIGAAVAIGAGIATASLAALIGITDPIKIIFTSGLYGFALGTCADDARRTKGRDEYGNLRDVYSNFMKCGKRILTSLESKEQKDLPKLSPKKLEKYAEKKSSNKKYSLGKIVSTTRKELEESLSSATVGMEDWKKLR